jgi:hypothetical protein
VAETVDELVAYWETQVAPDCDRHGYVTGTARHMAVALVVFDPVCLRCRGDVEVRFDDALATPMLVNCLLRRVPTIPPHDCGEHHG